MEGVEGGEGKEFGGGGGGGGSWFRVEHLWFQGFRLGRGWGVSWLRDGGLRVADLRLRVNGAGAFGFGFLLLQ